MEELSTLLSTLLSVEETPKTSEKEHTCFSEEFHKSDAFDPENTYEKEGKESRQVGINSRQGDEGPIRFGKHATSDTDSRDSYNVVRQVSKNTI